MSSSRSSGILLHITSLPSRYGIGDLGAAAYRFADALAQAGQQLWQILPLGPVGHGASPYSSLSTFAGNPLLISPDPLLEHGLLRPEEADPLTDLPAETVDYERLRPLKQQVLTRAYARHADGHDAVDAEAYRRFQREQADWLDDYALYRALKDAHDGAAWTDWPAPLAAADADALAAARDRHADAIDRHRFWQYLFHRQWTALKAYCNARSIRFFGDVPIYVAPDSADVWANQDLFQLDPDGQPAAVAGVPPDHFSETGQRWGNPIYRWDRMAERGYRWWMRRLKRTLSRVDLLRIDHFRGFEAYWSIPSDADTAEHGAWEDGPGAAFFDAVADELGDLPIVAEDLGLITPEVTALREQCGFPGMAVLQFAFEDDAEHKYLPHNFERNVVAYTGTHDNNTLRGWWDEDATGDEKAFARGYLDLARGAPDLCRQTLRMLWASVADRVVVPLQDVLGRGADARMNAPGTTTGNWRWRVAEGALTDDMLDHLATLTETYGRTPPADRSSSDKT